MLPSRAHDFRALSAVPLDAWATSLVVVLDWYDGPREGFCRLESPAIELVFQLLDERATPDHLDDRIFSLAVLPPGSVASLLPFLRFAGEPTGPVWSPRWEGDASALQAANAHIARLSAGSHPSCAVVRTSTFLTFLGLWPWPAEERPTDWFGFLGLDV